MSTAEGHHDHLREAQAVKARREHLGGTRKQNKGLIISLVIMFLIAGAVLGYVFLK